MKNILIIEDLPEVSEWMTMVIARIFPEAHIARADSVQQTRQLALSVSFDLALIDIGLPDGNGIHLIGELKQQMPAIYCVMSTIFDDPEHLFPALRAGADGYLLKDDSEDDLTAALCGILAGRPPLSASMARMMLQQFRPVSGSAPLTPREEAMLVLVSNGYSVKRAAESLAISPHTAASYLKTLYQKLQVNSRAEATLKAVQIGLIHPDRE